MKSQTERRVVTILVVDIQESTEHIHLADPDDAQEFLDRCFDHISAAIARESGAVISFGGDGAVAIFGWPQALEQHAYHACRAAWAMQYPANKAQFHDLMGPNGKPARFRVGVNTGLVSVRQINLHFGSRLDAIGSPVHVAAALQKRATPGAVLLGESVVAHCPLELNTCEASTREAASSHSAFYLLSPPPLQRPEERFRRFSTPIVGREAIRQTVRDAMPGVGKKGQFIALVGEPGIGKSRLLSEFWNEMLAAGVKAYIVSGETQHQLAAFSTARALVLSVLDGISFEDLVSDQSPSRNELFALRELLHPTAYRTKSTTVSQARMSRLLASILVNATSRQKVAFIIDDLQLVDSESLNTVSMFSQQLNPATLLIVAGRTEAEPFAEKSNATILHLEQMESSELQKLAEILVADRQISKQRINVALERASGNPLILEQFLCSHGEQSDNSQDELPRNVESLIHARLQNLDKRTMNVAQQLSVLGSEVEFGVAREIVALDKAALLKHAGELKRFAFLDHVDDDILRFRHAIVADACASSVSRHERQRIHRSAIPAISSHYTDLSAQFGRLANHAFGAGDTTAGLEYLWSALKVARKTSANQSLLLILDRAIECCDSRDRASDKYYVRFVLGAFDSMQQLGDLNRMRRYLPKAAQLAVASKDSKRACVARCHQALAHWYMGTYRDGLAIIEIARADAARFDSLPLKLHADFTMSLIFHAMGWVRESLSIQTDICRILSGNLATPKLGGTGVMGVLARAYAAYSHLELGDTDNALMIAKEALNIARNADEPYSETVAITSFSRALIAQHKEKDALDLLRRGMKIVDENHYGPVRASIAGFLSTALARIGSVEEAIEVAESKILDQTEVLGVGHEPYYLFAGYGEALLLAGRTEEGLAAIEKGIDLVKRVECPTMLVQGYRLRAEMLERYRPASPMLAQTRAAEAELCRAFGFRDCD